MAGLAWIYGAIMTACFLRYRRNKSPAQRPLAFITLKGMPRSRYSRVEPILMPWPCNGSRPAACAALPTVGSKTVAMFGSFGLIVMQRLTAWKLRLALVG